MPFLSFDQAWRDYLAAAPLLPVPAPPVTPRRISGVGEIAADFDLIVLDAWGVLNLGDVPIPTAPPAVAALRASGKHLVVLSNDGSADKDMAVAKHRRRGFDFSAAEIISGVDLWLDALATLPPLEQLGLAADDPLPFRHLTTRMVRLGTDAAAYDAVSAFVMLSCDHWTDANQALLHESLARQRRPLIIGNPDIVSPGIDTIAVEPGYYAHRLAASLGIVPAFLGKPFPAIYERVAARHPEIPPGRILCVGDTPHTDVLGGRNAGYRTMLVEDGFCRGRDTTALCRESGIWPDFIAPKL